MSDTEIEIVRSRDGGRAFDIVVFAGDAKYWGTVPAEVLDSEVGPDADETARAAWIGANGDAILAALRAAADGGTAPAPFSSVVLTEKQ
ncbi:hypothetical protein OG2516_03268 [Oceanicola granulosus HTCC2516]|uniref:Uncharacterized protein n=1 Tax=Oceanicola granulosus (strain ATCC BAA-861 / DSM 15982 / KCTC 12143 / HTCC2516) TaxID=314256 RepID=Q2CE72_OCEGH|nr:hypothetical protein [Oceanicola granulosus]EAR50988.1 hypothetical protein OG2516_03268 [Oceanicola granulosus HTCC2516]